ncbi:MAG: hypothetical protein JWM68_4094 [Verrucomicrobiales bacterium]|nr:hypothetical protein [Verrucomicrobiales bacterium]
MEALSVQRFGFAVRCVGSNWRVSTFQFPRARMERRVQTRMDRLFHRWKAGVESIGALVDVLALCGGGVTHPTPGQQFDCPWALDGSRYRGDLFILLPLCRLWQRRHGAVADRPRVHRSLARVASLSTGKRNRIHCDAVDRHSRCFASMLHRQCYLVPEMVRIVTRSASVLFCCHCRGSWSPQYRWPFQERFAARPNVLGKPTTSHVVAI